MEAPFDFLAAFWSALPLAITLALAIVFLAIARRVLERVGPTASGRRFRNQLVMLGLNFGALIAVVLALPISEATRGQLLSLIGILLSAAIALSSTTLLGNAMAGIMLRTVKNFRSGDFIRTGEHAGRVSERGLFHTEIQTPDRELTTLPNLYLVTHPVTVVRSSGTIIAATLSLGYDVPRDRIEKALLAAAEECKLEEPFVQVRELGDFSITYRVAGLLTDTKQILSTESRLRGASVDALHAAGIEIVSPNFMNTRALDPQKQFVPEGGRRRRPAAEVDEAARVEELVFDKAEEAESREERIERLQALEKTIADRRKVIDKTENEEDKARYEARLASLEERRDVLRKQVEEEVAGEG